MRDKKGVGGDNSQLSLWKLSAYKFVRYLAYAA
jgi:hypothetical protein